MYCIKKKNKKGFTLIELLAVIVILAVIALIAVPQVLRILNKSRLSAAEDSVYGIVKSAETYVSNFMLQNNGAIPSEELVFSCSGDGCILQNADNLSNYELDGLDKLEFKGTKPKSGKVVIKNSGNNIQASLVISNYGCNYVNGKGECSSLTGPTSYTPTDSDIGYTGVLKVVYLDPTNLDKSCNENNINSDTETKIGCMKWYAYSDDGTNYTMILDHNTTVDVAWISKEDYIAVGGTETDYGTDGKNDKGPITVNKQLGIDTTGWDSSLSPRLITAQEIANITGNTTWTADVFNFFLDGASVSGQGKSRYAWLFDYTDNCTSRGCNIADNSTAGYWTSTPRSDSSDRAWYVNADGYMGNYLVTYTYYGVRPVITIEKSKIS